MLKAIIIEDEYPARLRLMHLLEGYLDKIILCGYADTGQGALTLIQSQRPEVIFLDIHLPDMKGFDVLKALDYNPMVIFTTAYLDYAVKAFEVYSIDYLVKPFDQERFGLAMAKLFSFSPHNYIEKPDYKKLAELFYQTQKKPALSSLAVRSGNKILLIDYEDITLIKAEDKYSLIRLENGKSFLCEKSLAKLEELLPDDFIRVHRSFIVNKVWITEIHRYFKGRLMIVIDDKDRTSIVTSESYTKQVKSILGL